ncbi:hypothetical protein E4P39_03945 [Blastococcus sp. CT_GayMR19]|uniref:hypothetical protein n=1 Tax=Blastococcus sp. CT_GayMR19 TaxID=2559608 RepID=UPI001073A4B6|nr:hypothetical protein [Blastococcus sp. CT_GayMR19]TFV78376.1 hypothetical protein E4P39_03945 [Blastococcus sp. CT_GayMR19]
MPDNLTPVFSDPLAAAVCPECGGEQLVPHPAGLVFRHHTLGGCSLQDAEDTRLVADRSLADVRGWPFERPTTPTERTLLATAGITVDEDATCLVDYLSPGIRRRTWLAA